MYRYWFVFEEFDKDCLILFIVYIYKEIDCNY